MNYKKIYTSPTEYIIREVENRRNVSENQPDYLAWLAAGNEPEEVPYTPPPVYVPTLEEAKAAKINEINMAKWAAVDGGTEYMQVGIATDADAQRLANGAVTQCLIDPDYTCSWKTAGGQYINMNKDMIVGVATAIREHIQGCFDREAELTATVANLETVEEVEAVAW